MVFCPRFGKLFFFAGALTEFVGSGLASRSTRVYHFGRPEDDLKNKDKNEAELYRRRLD